VDNTVKFDLGKFVSALYCGTWGNMNGIIGRIELNATPAVWVDAVNVHPDAKRKIAWVKVRVGNATGKSGNRVLDVGTMGTQFTMNGRPLFLRGTLKCSVWPLTGYPPTDVEAWRKIYRVIQSYGLNHMRFHSWCPPEAAFVAADEEGIILQVEGPVANVPTGNIWTNFWPELSRMTARASNRR
jgi:hypothetical protein